jgi:hypothetical protein
VIEIAADTAVIAMGQPVVVTACAHAGAQPIGGLDLWAYLNGRRWGANAVTDKDGKAVFILPLPEAGAARIHVIRAPPPKSDPAPVWGTETDFTTDTPLPPGAGTSPEIDLKVTPRHWEMRTDPARRIGAQWAPWFSRYNAHWDTREALPLLGQYASADPRVIRQQALWMDDAGIDFMQVDWSNNIGNWKHFKDHPPGVDEIMASTTSLLDTLAQMRAEGIPTPQVVLLLGIAPPWNFNALNEEIQWVREHYLQNPRYGGLFVSYLGKPLVTILCALPPETLRRFPPVDAAFVTVRWVWVNSDADDRSRLGWWSWMDSCMPPRLATFGSKPEAMTITPAFFNANGWLDPQSVGRRGGATFVREFQAATQARPRFLFLHQWNEFAGSKVGGGPLHNIYMDEYSAELSDDLEPAVPRASGYRPGRGWGFYYLNLARALAQIYKGQAPESTVLALEPPRLTGATLRVHWETMGKAPAAVSIEIDGAEVWRGPPATTCDLDASRLSAGPHLLTLRAAGAVTRFPLSSIAEDEPAATMLPVLATATFTKIAPRAGRRF